MAQQQQNITIAAPGFQGINTEESPLQQDPSFCLVAENAVLDRYGRVGSRKAFAEFTTAVNVTYAPAVGAVTTEVVTHRLGHGVIGTISYVLATVSIFQFDAANALLQEDYRICRLVTGAGPTYTLDEIPSQPTLTTPATLKDAKILSFKDEIFIFSQGNDVVVFDGTVLTLLSAAAGYLPPQDDTGTLAALLDGNVATAAYGRLWVSGVNSDFNTIYYSDLLIPTQWYDGKAAPTDPANTGGIIDVSEYWPNGSDRIVGLVAHNSALYVFGRNSIIVYNNAASGDPASADGIVLADTISNLGLVSRDAVTNIGSDVLFVDDSGVRSLGRTIQEKSVPIGDLTYNVRRDVTEQIANTNDKKKISLTYWPNEDLTLLLFSEANYGYTIEMRSPSSTGGNKITEWTGCFFERALYYEQAGLSRVVMASNKDAGLLEYDGSTDQSGEAYDFKYESSVLTFGQPANLKFLKQIDYTVVSTGNDSLAYSGWGFTGRLDYTKLLTVNGQSAGLFGISLFGIAQYNSGLTRIKRYRVNTKGSGESIVIGIRASILGNSFSLQEINVQTLLGRLN